MIQRIQTLFLLLGIVACLVCVCFPIAELRGEGITIPARMYNGCVVAEQGSSLAVASAVLIPLFALLVLAAAVGLWTIFTYKHRLRQMKLCIYAICLLVVWYATLAFVALTQMPEGATFHPLFATALPLLAICLFALARRSIHKDEQLVRSADRIR